MGEEQISAEAALEFFRGQIEKNRAVLSGLSAAAISFGIQRDEDGLTEWRTIYIEENEVKLSEGAVPITYAAPLALIYASQKTLCQISSGESSTNISAEGDTELLSKVARCFNQPKTWLDVRSGK